MLIPNPHPPKKAVDLQHPEEHLATLLDILQIALDPDRNPELLARYLQNFLAFADNLDMPQFHKKLTTLTDSPMKTKGLNLLEQYIAAGREEGIAAGREEGLSSGRHEALLSTTRRQLTRRFGPLPDPVDAHLAKASSAELEALTEQLLDAPSLNALFPGILGAE